jgi:D-alanyl-D-alanine carboxypeptidase/D-alanyl-D-alanine-endopeptidase (penicillin-binding protein 4)
VGELADAIAAAGITRIQGSVIGDETRYDTERFHPAWPDRFRGQNQIGPVSALNVNDGFAEYPAEWGGLQSKVQATDPAANAARVITDLLAERGVTVDGAPQSGIAPDDVTQVASVESSPLSDITTQALMDSDNDTAEMLFKELGLDEQGSGTWDTGVTAATEILTEAGVSLDGLEIVDGSGLSEQDRLSCNLLVDLLTRPDTGPTVVDGLAVAGESGTLEDRWNGTEVEGRLRGKTGTLRNVSALAGQVTSGDAGTLTYAYVATVPEPEQLTLEQTELFEPLGNVLVEDYSVGVELAAILPEGYPGDDAADSAAEAADAAAD